MMTPATMEELAQYAIAEISKTAKVVGLAWKLQWYPNVSNSHSAPKGYPTNWGKRGTDKDGNSLSSGYPGWSGRIWIRYAPTPKSFDASRLLEKIRIYPGTGGGGSYDGIWSAICSAAYRAKVGRKNEPHCYSWDCKIFDYDWPEVAEVFEKERVWAILSDKQVPNPKSNFAWTEPETEKADNEFMIQQAFFNAKKQMKA